MHIRLIAVGDRQPAWVDSAFGDYASRLPRRWQFRLDAVPAAHRKGAALAEVAKAAEGARIIARLRPDEHVVLLDEGGRQLSSRQLADKLRDWQAAGEDLAFVIGGADGVSTAVAERANFTWSLSKLTLPHALARVLFAEQIYRAFTLTTGHPYHRD